MSESPPGWLNDVPEPEDNLTYLDERAREINNPAAKRTKNRILKPSDLKAMSRPIPVIKDILYSNQEHVVFGPQGTSKTFLILSWFLHVAFEIPWHGKRVTRKKCLLIAGEGGGRVLYDRIAAFLADRPDLDPAIADEYIGITEFPVHLMDESSVDEILDLIKEQGEYGLIAIDTLAANMGGGDENAPKDMSIFWDALRRIRLNTEAGVVLVHHTGHADNTRSQGSNLIRRNPDIELRVDRDANDETLFGLLGGGRLKNRNGKGCGLLGYRLKEVPIGESDSNGDEISSCVIEFTDDEPEFGVPGKKAASSPVQGKNQNAIWAWMKTMKPDEDGKIYVSSIDYKAKCEELRMPRSTRSAVRKAFNEKGLIKEAVGGFTSSIFAGMEL